MKKLTAILLILIFLFNLGGYRLWFYYAQQQSDKQFEVSLDNKEYNEEDLITLSVPISLPYQTNWKEFERADGEIEYQGKIYKYVKRKVFNGELVLLCLPDHNKMRLETAKVNFFKLANELMQNNSSKKSSNSHGYTLKNMLSEYDKNSFVFNSIQTNSALQNFRLPYKEKKLVSSPHISPEQPPDFFLT